MFTMPPVCVVIIFAEWLILTRAKKWKKEHGNYSISTAFYLNVLPKGGVRIIKNEWKKALYCQRNLQRRCLFARGGLRDEKDEHGNYLISTAFCLNV